MCLLRQCQRLILVLLVLGVAEGYLPGYADSEVPLRYESRRAKEAQARWESSDAAARQYQHRPVGGTPFEQVDPASLQPTRREYMPRSYESIASRELHKCRIWVPTEVLAKYPYANLIQTDVANKLSSIEVCCTGYSATRLKGVTVCRPICSCANGSCRVPGECDCYEGFVKNDNGDCVFACPLGCQNGRCFLDGSCQCDVGYTLDETRRFCRPICSSNCDNNPRHNCTEPEICSCRKGYQLTNDGCQPVCDPDCGIGGICRENNECDCGPGYSLRDFICQTDCYQKCTNGVCVSRNRCICNPGFTYHEQSMMCVPV